MRFTLTGAQALRLDSGRPLRLNALNTFNNTCLWSTLRLSTQSSSKIDT